jgi:hypothetical protein
MTKHYTEDEAKEIKRLNCLVNKFSHEMIERLADKVQEGYHGWEMHHFYDLMLEQLEKDVKVAAKVTIPRRGSRLFIDIANRAMFLWNLENNE